MTTRRYVWRPLGGFGWKGEFWFVCFLGLNVQRFARDLPVHWFIGRYISGCLDRHGWAVRFGRNAYSRATDAWIVKTREKRGAA